MRKIWIGVAVVAVIVAIPAGCLYWLGTALDTCGDTPVQTVPSPSGSLKAVLFERDCGATTGFSSQVSILSHDENLGNEGGNVFHSR